VDEWHSSGDADPPLAPFGSRNAAHHVISHGTMHEFAHSISTDMGRPVLDKTGIAGVYFFFLQWDEDGEFGAAVQEELGSRFQSGNSPINTLIVDYVEPPSVN
jgi:uncharacterized protein (TIGR03435 family)